MRRRLYAIRKIHRFLRLPDPTYDEEINLSLRRVRRTKLVRPKQAKGLTQNYLERFIAGEPDTPWGLRNKVMLSLGYELLSRRSELVALRTKDIEFRPNGKVLSLNQFSQNFAIFAHDVLHDCDLCIKFRIIKCELKAIWTCRGLMPLL